MVGHVSRPHIRASAFRSSCGTHASEREHVRLDQISWRQDCGALIYKRCQ
jgi:hypothetical protein